MHEDTFFNELSSLIEENLKKQNIQGLVISVLTSEKVIWSKGFGYVDGKKSFPVDTNTFVGLQSTTKTFTAISLLRAVELGLLKLEDPIIKYYPEFKVKQRFEEDQIPKITFKHLLSHTSGLPNATIVGGCFDNTNVTFEERINSIKEAWLEYKPGAGMRYSNIGMDLVAYCLHKITGDYQSFIKKEVLNPIGISEMYFKTSEAIKKPNCFRGYLGQHEGSYHTNDNGFGCGTGFLTHSDFGKFVQFLLNTGKTSKGEQLIDKELFEEMYEGDVEGYGFGVFITEYNGEKRYSHPGGGFGFSSVMEWIPKYDIAVIAQSNQENQDILSTLPEKIFNWYIEKENIPKHQFDFPDQNKDNLIPPKDLLQKLDGLYIGLMGKTKFFFETGEIFIRLFRKKYKMECKGGDFKNNILFVSEVTKYIEFFFDQSSDQVKVKYYLNSWNSMLLLYKVLEMNESTSKGDTSKWNNFIGIYRHFYYVSEINFYIVTVKDDNLQINGEPLFYFRDDVYFTSSGEIVEFFENFLRFKSVKATKFDKPIDFFQEIYKKDKNHRYIQMWIFDTVIGQLKTLEKNEDAEKLHELKEHIFTK